MCDKKSYKEHRDAFTAKVVKHNTLHKKEMKMELGVTVSKEGSETWLKPKRIIFLFSSTGTRLISARLCEITVVFVQHSSWCRNDVMASHRNRPSSGKKKREIHLGLNHTFQPAAC